MFKLLIELLVFYLIYKFIFDFVLPIYRASKQMNRKMQEVRQKMEAHEKTFSQSQQTRGQAEAPKKSKPREDDYIDFEEIK